MLFLISRFIMRLIAFANQKVLLFIFIVFLLTSCNNTEITYWENGNKKSEISYRSEKFHGAANWWYKSGALKMQSNYVNNLLDGQSIRWFENGIIHSKENYINNLLNGVSITNNIIGKKICEENYINDTLHGSIKQWYSNGQMQIEGKYFHGNIDERWMYYDKNGTVVGKGDYVKGTGTMKAWYPNGKLKREINYMNSVKHGKEILLDSKGEISEIYIYDSGELISSETAKY